VLHHQLSTPGRSHNLLSFPKRHTSPTSYSTDTGFCGGADVDDTVSLSAQVMNEWSYTSTAYIYIVIRPPI
jgi:hypothetical protein